MDRFDSMRAFARVVELGSFTRAANSLNLQKTTVSAQISALERGLGVRLLNRTTRSVTATPEGGIYYERVVSLLSDLDEAEAAVTTSKVEPKGRLRIDMPPAIGHRIVIPALGSFIERYPGIVLEVGCTDRPVDLVGEGIDCVIRGNLIHDEGLVARALGVFDIATCASPAYLEKYGTPATPMEMENHLVCRLFSPKNRRFFEFNFTKNGVRTNVKGRHVAAYNDIESSLTGALSGLGIVQLPLYILEEHLATGRLTRILTDYTSEGVPVNLLYPENRMLSAKVKAFASWSRDLFASTKHVNVAA
ncbi:LysR family transcriptional regulator [Burkholderia aenigmatica]|uniref:LysR family transcriptional regulator n=1 Tax=Burkholderia cepacia complex TaxID=87882 RepID=UPI00158D2D69|nr:MULTISPECIES: LysR family transcriptional regulator [Burkholderia cepacia complex]UKD16841.1 LysR family transcriptional regulator [Burkholderia aenigmatica]